MFKQGQRVKHAAGGIGFWLDSLSDVMSRVDFVDNGAADCFTSALTPFYQPGDILEVISTPDRQLFPDWQWSIGDIVTINEVTKSHASFYGDPNLWRLSRFEWHSPQEPKHYKKAKEIIYFQERLKRLPDKDREALFYGNWLDQSTQQIIEEERREKAVQWMIDWLPDSKPILPPEIHQTAANRVFPEVPTISCWKCPQCSETGTRAEVYKHHKDVHGESLPAVTSNWWDKLKIK